MMAHAFNLSSLGDRSWQMSTEVLHREFQANHGTQCDPVVYLSVWLSHTHTSHTYTHSHRNAHTHTHNNTKKKQTNEQHKTTSHSIELNQLFLVVLGMEPRASGMLSKHPLYH